MAIAVTYVTHVNSTSNLTTYTFSSTSTGTAAADRINVVGFYGQGASQAGVGSASINGVTASLYVEQIRGTNGGVTSIWRALNPTGTSGDIAVTFNSAQSRAGAGVWSVTGAADIAADTETAHSSSAESVTITLAIPTGGAAIACFFNLGTTAVAWTNATERFDVLIESDDRHSGADTTSTGSVDITADGDPSVQALAGVAFSPFSIVPILMRHYRQRWGA